MFKKFVMATGLTLGFGVSAAAAQSCGGVYTVQGGDTLSQIADTQYKDARKWSVVYGNNIGTIGDDPNALRIGQELTLSCIGGLPVGLSAARTSVTAAAQPAVVNASVPVNTTAQNIGTTAVRVLTGDDFAPFTDRSLENGGLANEIVEVAFRNSEIGDNFKTYWVNDWSSHLNSLLMDSVLDVGHPWSQPDCDATPDNFRCENYIFSENLFEFLILLFTDKSRPFEFNSDADIVGKTLCRPKGYFVHDLDKNGRNWVRDGKIKMKRPTTVKGCFDLLVAGEVDAVAINEFTGRASVKSLGLTDQVNVVSSRPVSIEGLYVVAHKTHPKGQAYIDTFNAGLAKIRASGDYQKVVDVHMSRIWEDF